MKLLDAAPFKTNDSTLSVMLPLLSHRSFHGKLKFCTQKVSLDPTSSQANVLFFAC